MLLQSLFDVLPVLALVGLGMGGLEVSRILCLDIHIHCTALAIASCIFYLKSLHTRYAALVTMASRAKRCPSP